MKINIRNKENKEIVVQLAKEKLIINIDEDKNERNPEWNINSVNQFLIKIAAHLDFDEKLEIDKEDEFNSPVFNHIFDLFSEFVTEYNKES